MSAPSATSQAPSRPKVPVALSCSQCDKPLSNPGLPASTKRFCSQDCAIMATQAGEGQVTSTQPSSSRASQKRSAEQDGDSSRSSAEDFQSPKSNSSLPSSSLSNNADGSKPPPKKKKKNDEIYDWTDRLADPNFVASSVLQVKHAPLSRMWENISEGMKLEVENKDVDVRINETAFWVASVIKIQGYYVLLRYEGFGNDATGDFWIHLCAPSIHHVGWCANKGKPLIPPKSIAKKFTDWRSFLVHRLTGARTLPAHFLMKLESGIRSVQKVNDVLEVVDKNQISQLKVATVTQVIGRRLHVSYWDSEDDGGFWCHEESRLIHPVGWAKTIGHQISSPENYNPPSLPTTPYDADFENMNLRVGMKLEAIDPLNLSAICAATIKKVLKRGYVMVRIDCYDEDESGFDWFCYHISSNSVFPCGFCHANGVTLIPPKPYDKEDFKWDDYFKSTNTCAAPIKPKEKVLAHGFKDGMKIEAADLMDPRLICVATVGKVVGRLLKIHFDGWEEEYDQWMDARSPDIYPIGWCELVNYKLEPPRPPQPIQRPVAGKKAKKGGKKKGGKQANSKQKAEAKGTPGPITSQVNPVKQATVNSGRSVATASASAVEPVATSRRNSIGSVNGNAGPVNQQTNGSQGSDQLNTDPASWSIIDVADYLSKHDCAAYCEFFTKNNVDGRRFLALSKEEVIELMGGKVGPAIKIFELISQLKRSYAARARTTGLAK